MSLFRRSAMKPRWSLPKDRTSKPTNGTLTPLKNESSEQEPLRVQPAQVAVELEKTTQIGSSQFTPEHSRIPTDITPTTNSVILAWLTQHQKIRAFVDPEGNVYYVRDSQGERMLQQLFELVAEEVGRVTHNAISLVDYSTLRVRTQSGQESVTTRNDLVDMVLTEAVSCGASDVYISIQTDTCFVHFRTHGMRFLFAQVSTEDGRNMVRSMWSLSEKGQWDAIKPCDTAFDFGRFRIRGSSLPDTRGCSVVLRLRDPEWVLPLPALGYSKAQLQRIDTIASTSGGLVVVSGVTNSGKSTTLTSFMDALNDSQMIIEIADPIEMEFRHITHIGIDHYSTNIVEQLKAILAGLVRQNPDYLFIGEIRDEQTAEAAINMTLQGKRVRSTVHAASCLSALSRLERLGIDRELLSQPGFLSGVVNQSLVPVVCTSCAFDAKTLDDSIRVGRAASLFGSTEKLRWRNPNGCEHCLQGIAGQTVVAEVMDLSGDANHDARSLIREGNYSALGRKLRDQGMKLKAQHAADKIRAGRIDPDLTQEIIGRIDLAVSSKSEPRIEQLRTKQHSNGNGSRHG